MDARGQDAFEVATRRAAGDPRLGAAIDAAFEAADLWQTGHAFVADLERGARADYRAADDVYPASIVKIPIMSCVFARFVNDTLRPDDICVISPSNVTATAEPTPCVAGYRATIQELTELMIERSDNIAANQLIDVLGRENVTRAMRAAGLSDFHLGRKLSGSEPLVADPEATERNRLTPADVGRLLESIARNEVPGAARQREILLRCVDDRKLAAGLRAGDRLAHKTGETSETSHDAGILETADGKRYVIALYTTMSAGDGMSRSDAPLAAWMRRLRQAL